jgi:hypothetical protein
MNPAAAKARAVARAPGAVLQRKCACGSSAGHESECEVCKKKALQRRAIGAGSGIAPPIVHDVLRSPGQALDEQTRSFFEPRFGHDFSKVRIYADSRAHQSARAVNALAYTVGRQIVFDADQYRPNSPDGRKLLGHELAHVLQQENGTTPRSPILVADSRDRSEAEADVMEESVMRGRREKNTAVTTPRLMRRLRADRPTDRVPPAGGQGTGQTKAEIVQQYLRTLAQGSDATVDPATGEVSLATAYCPGFLGGLVEGARFGYHIGESVGGHVPLLAPVLGIVGGVIGGLVGGIAGLFGSSRPSAAASSSTPTGSTCLCDMANARNMWTIEINDSDHPRTMSEPDPGDPTHMRFLPGGRVRVPSPNAPTTWGAATMTGQLQDMPPWLILGHELCGHAWEEEMHRDESHGAGAVAVRDPQTGQRSVSNAQLLSGNTIAPHGDESEIQRENLLRQEHGMALRGFRVRDPYCGESFSRTSPQGTPQFTEGEDPQFTFMQQCEFLRSQLPENQGGRYRIDEQIPEPTGGGSH